MDIVLYLYRSIFYYFYIVVIVRFLGKREVGELGIFDLIFLLILADMAAISIENVSQPIWYYIVIIALLTLLQKLISFIQLKCPKVRKVLDGNPSIIVLKGKLCVEEMKKQLYTVEDLLTQLREKGIRLISDIEVAILETDGELSVFEYRNTALPLPVIVSGKLVEDNLKILNITEEKINELLNKTPLKKIYCAYYYNHKLLIIDQQ